MVAGEQLKDEDGQCEAVLLLGPVGIVTLDFRSLEIGHPHVVGKGQAGSRISEPVRVAVHQGNIIQSVRLSILLVNVADDVASLVNGLVAQGEVLRDAHTVFNPYLAALACLGALGHSAVVVTDNWIPGEAVVQLGHHVAGDNPVFPDHVLGPGDVPLIPRFADDGIIHHIPEFGFGVGRLFAVMPNFHRSVGLTVHLIHHAFTTIAQLAARHNGVAVFVLEIPAG